MGIGKNIIDWIMNNKSTALYYGGKTIAASDLPIVSSLGVAATAAAEAMQEVEAKEAMQKEIEQQRMRQYGNRYVAYSDMPRIHYSKKPYSYILHHHPYFNRRETFDDVLKKYVADRNKRKQEKEKEEKKLQKQQKQKENEQKQKEKWERQEQNKKAREERQKQQKIADENKQEQKRINFERHTQILNKQIELQKAKAENRKPKPKSPAVLDKSFRDDLKAAFKMYKEGK